MRFIHNICWSSCSVVSPAEQLQMNFSGYRLFKICHTWLKKSSSKQEGQCWDLHLIGKPGKLQAPFKPVAPDIKRSHIPLTETRHVAAAVGSTASPWIGSSWRRNGILLNWGMTDKWRGRRETCAVTSQTSLLAGWDPTAWHYWMWFAERGPWRKCVGLSWTWLPRHRRGMLGFRIPETPSDPM